MKNLLKDGMIVQLANQMYYLVIGNYLIGYLSHFSLNSFNDDLTFDTSPQRKTLQLDRTINKLHEWDIIRIWTLKDMTNLHGMLEDKDDPWVNRFGEKIFDRFSSTEETVEMTVDDICKALGKNVKVVK